MGFKVTHSLAFQMRGYTRIEVVGELDSDDAILHWLLLIVLYHLSFDISSIDLLGLELASWEASGSVCPVFEQAS